MDTLENISNPIIIYPKTTHKASIIWLHGLGANGHDFVPLVEALNLPKDLGIKFIFPHAPTRPVTINAGMIMPAWFDLLALDIQGPQDETGIRQMEPFIYQLIQQEIDQEIESKQIILAGFSQGGAMALHCGLRFQQSLAGIIGLSTFLPLHDTIEKEAHAMNQNTPIMLAHGRQDTLVPTLLGEMTRDYLQTLNYQMTWHDYPIGHEVCAEEIEDIKQWLLKLL